MNDPCLRAMDQTKDGEQIVSFFFKGKRLTDSNDECLKFNALTSCRPAQSVRKFDMNMFYWIIIELIY